MSAACYRGSRESSFCAETLSETISFGRLIRDVCCVSVYRENTYFPPRELARARSRLKETRGKLFRNADVYTRRDTGRWIIRPPAWSDLLRKLLKHESLEYFLK